MIVVGYQGIGKSTLAGRNHKYIDLERKRLTIPLVLADGQELHGEHTNRKQGNK